MRFPAHGRGFSVASGHVTAKLRPHRQPLEPQEAFLFDEYGGGTRRKVFRDEYLDSLIFNPLVGR